MKDIDDTVSFHLEAILEEIVARSKESSKDRRDQVINYYANVSNVIYAITGVIHHEARKHWGLTTDEDI
jgi:hypothetical protein